MNLTLLPDRLEQNMDKTLRLALVPGIPASLFRDISRGLKLNVSVQNVRLTICCGSFLSPTQYQQLQAFIEAILRLPNIQTLHIRGTRTRRGGITVLPISCLSSITVRSKKLSSLSLCGLLLRGDSKDFQGFSAWLLKLKSSLQDVRLLGIGLSGQHTTSVLTPILRVAADLPLLENLEISDTFTPMGVLEEDQVPLCLFQSSKTRKNCLRRLSISDFLLSDQALASVFAVLQQNTYLEEVALSGDLTWTQAPHFTTLLESNKTLTAMALRLENLKDERVNQELVQALSKARHLRVLSLCSFCESELSPIIRLALTNMLRNNFSLEYLYVPCPYSDTVFWDQVRMYLGLNAAGRKDLVLEQGNTQEDQRDQWVDMLTRASVDINSSFYLLQANPGLCSPVSTPSRPALENSASERDQDITKIIEAFALSKSKSPFSAPKVTDMPIGMPVWASNSHLGSVKRQHSEYQSMVGVLRMAKQQKEIFLPSDATSARQGLARLFIR